MTYLLYSANEWMSDEEGNSPYATGYAVCDQGPVAPCRRVQDQPLIASEGSRQGPGGSDPFVSADGSLKIAYHAFWGGEHRDPHPRRLHIGNLIQNADLTLTFTGDTGFFS